MLNNNIEDGFISAFATKKPLESTLSRERAVKEADKITVPLRSRMRKSRKRCLVPMVIITILILSGLLSAVIFILVNPIQKGGYTFNIHCKKKSDIGLFWMVEFGDLHHIYFKLIILRQKIIDKSWNIGSLLNIHVLYFFSIIFLPNYLICQIGNFLGAQRGSLIYVYEFL